MNNQRFIFFCITLLYVHVKIAEATCWRGYNPFDPPPARGLQLRRILGRWYGIYFKNVEMTPRCTISLPNFMAELSMFNSTSLEFQQIGSFWSRRFENRFIATDYRNYIIRWACGQTDPTSGKCVDYFVSVWSRSPNGFSRRIEARIAQIVRCVFCLNIFTDFIGNSFDRVCPMPPSQSSQQRNCVSMFG